MAFNVFDRDKSGGISQNELKYILGEYNVNAKEHLWHKMIQQIDLNQDGQISYEEFHKMMMDVINNKNKRFSMLLKKLLLMDNNIDDDILNQNPIKNNATVFESRPKKNFLKSKSDLQLKKRLITENDDDDDDAQNEKENKKNENDQKNMDENNNKINNPFVYKEKK